MKPDTFIKKRIVCTVTNDLVFDQRMQRICSSLVKAGYEVTLVGREKPNSPPLTEQVFKQIRLPVSYEKGKRFYIHYNIALYKYLIQVEADAFCAIDLDTIVPVYWASKKRQIPRMYDAHEFFTEMIEVKRRPIVHFIWKMVEKWLVPKFKHGYTVGFAIAKEFEVLYRVNYGVVRNISKYYEPLKSNTPFPEKVKQILEQFDKACNATLPIILYQGAVNEGRALPELLIAMEQVEARLLIAGSGNLETEIANLIENRGLSKKVYMCGNVSPENLRYLTHASYIGVTIFDALSKNQYYSLGNKFFDYMMAGKPQVCVSYPEYASILKEYPVAEPLQNTEPTNITRALNNLLQNPVLYEEIHKNCLFASKCLNWETEEIILLKQWQVLWNH